MLMKLAVACVWVGGLCWPQIAHAPKAAAKQDMIDALMERERPGSASPHKALNVDELRRSLREGLNSPPRATTSNGLLVIPNAKVAEALSNRSWVSITIYFDYDAAVIKPEFEADLTRLAETLSAPAFAGARFMVAGHTDGRGARDYNLTLSQRRADAVQKFILSRAPGLSKRLVAIGLGMEQLRNLENPADPINRRVQLYNIGPAEAAAGGPT
ncbi:MAG: flagellar motor protein MotB [Hyphomicrobiales bacterium]|jgi:outer membrane protein OmpA-like peptidoglycan-associated protein|nr:flagellar motor protein MotB [Hyphomicrobiales bacterium]